MELTIRFVDGDRRHGMDAESNCALNSSRSAIRPARPFQTQMFPDEELRVPIPSRQHVRSQTAADQRSKTQGKFRKTTSTSISAASKRASFSSDEVRNMRLTCGARIHRMGIKGQHHRRTGLPARRRHHLIQKRAVAAAMMTIKTRRWSPLNRPGCGWGGSR